jgi:hypothetical protein
VATPKRKSQFNEVVAKYNLKDAPSIAANLDGEIPVDALGVTLVSDRLIDFTIPQAVRYIELPVYQGERGVDQRHAQSLVDEMARGRFNWTIIIVASCLLETDGVTYKINGQHTAWARLDRPYEPSPKVREHQYKAPTVEALKALYGSFDRNKPRSDTHLTRIELVGEAAVKGLKAETITAVTRGLRFWLFEGEAFKRVTPAVLAATITDRYANLFNTVGTFFQNIHGDKNPILKRQPVMAALCATFDKVPTVAPLFWRDVAEGTNLTKGDARWHLCQYLNKTALVASRRQQSAKVVDPEEMYCVCLSAWNRWRDNEQVQKLQAPTKRPRPA